LAVSSLEIDDVELPAGMRQQLGQVAQPFGVPQACHRTV
jgi:hypothetical protein